MTEEESRQHIEMFVRNKVREGYWGLFPKASARKNVLRAWDNFKDKGANLEAVTILGVDNATNLLRSTIDRVLSSKEELKKVRTGDYLGSQEDLLKELWKD